MNYTLIIVGLVVIGIGTLIAGIGWNWDKVKRTSPAISQTQSESANAQVHRDVPGAKQPEQQASAKLKRKPQAKQHRSKEIIRMLSRFLNEGTVIQAQCAGSYLNELKGQTVHDRFVKWCKDIDDFFRKEEELDFDAYHSWFENTSKHSVPFPLGLSQRDAWVWQLVEGRKRNLNEMINEFRVKK